MPPELVTVTVIGAAVEGAVPKVMVAVVEIVPVVPSVTALPAVLTENEQGVTVIGVPTTIPGMVEAVTLKMQEP